MVLAKTFAWVSLMLLMVWVDDWDTESADLWTWHDPGAYEACVAAGASPDRSNSLGRSVAFGPSGFHVGLDDVYLDADGGAWQLSTHNWTDAIVEEPVTGTAGLAAATRAAVVSFDGEVATFDGPWDWQSWFEAQQWQVRSNSAYRVEGTSGPWRATWSAPQCSLAPGGQPLQQFELGAVLWITPDDQVQGILREPGTAGDAIRAMPGWYGDWREPHFEGLQPVTWMSRPGPW